MYNIQRYFFILLIAALSFFVDWYVFQGVKTLTGALTAGGIVHGIYWFFSVGLTLSLLAGFYRSLPGGGFTPFVRVAFHTFLTIFIAKVVFLAVLLTEDVYRSAAALVNVFREGGDLAELLPERSKFVSQIGFFISGIPLVSFVYGMARGKYDYKVHRHVLYYDDLPQAFDGFTITQISDVHAGSLRNAVAVQRGIDLIKAQNSDLFVFTGDLVNNKASELEPWLDHLRQIRAPYGQFSVLGNHDYGDYVSWPDSEEKLGNIHRLMEHHKAVGFRLLLDENVTIEKDGERISLMGVQNWGLGFGQRGDLEKALAGIDQGEFKILLSHDPSHWDAQVKSHPSKIHLTLSGHTHGMQMGIEVPGFKWSPVKYRYPNWAGMAHHNGRHLNVNRGFGFIGFEGRVGIWPEITVIELRKRSKT